MYKYETNTFFTPQDYNTQHKYLYARKDGVGRKDVGQLKLNSWQAWNKVTSEEEFLQPEEYTYRAGDSLLFPWWFIQLDNGDIYRKVIVYSNDKTLSPNGDTVELVLKNPEEMDFSETSTAREYDGIYEKIIGSLNDVNQLFANLATATDKVIKIVNEFTPMSGVDYLTMYNGVNAKRSQILQKIDVQLLRRLWTMVVNYFQVHDTMFANHAGVKNVIRKYPAGTEKIGASLVMYYSWLGVFLPVNEDGSISSGRRDVNYPGPVQSFKYTDPQSLYDLDYWMQSLSAELKNSEQILHELAVIAPDVDHTVTDVDNPENYLQPGDPYYKDPLSDDELEQKKNEETGNQENDEEKSGEETQTTTGKKIAVAATIFTILKLLF